MTGALLVTPAAQHRERIVRVRKEIIGGTMRIPNALKIEIIRRGMTQREVARLSNIAENRLSDLCSGHREPSPAERRALERVLDGEHVVDAR